MGGQPENVELDCVISYADINGAQFTKTLYFDTERFTWAKWLRHCCNEDSTLRNVVYDEESAKVQLERLYHELSTRSEHEKQEDEGWPRHIVVFVYRSEYIRNHPVSQYFEKSGALGVNFIFFEEYEELVPRGCREMIYLDNDERTGRLVLCEKDDLRQSFSYQSIADDTLMAIAKKTFPIHVVEATLEGDMTKNISLLELLGVGTVEQLNVKERWESSRVHKSMSVPLGVKTKNDIVSLDLHEKYHGPHGLVAGTTGSGKSEILQSYILSMAIHFHPHEVGFLIIDFKGGGMANQFEDLPHLIGTITNIEGREVDRSLKAIKAELLRRQKLFAEVDVNQIDKYILLHKQNPEKAPVPLPHLIMIVDEFAELKAEYPDFMKELISAARIGRSLGVHLILATQKPSGVVDDQIWSNSKFKLCLKVQTHADSKEVIRTPLAAEIREPGRAYLQVGNNEIFELFQSAYSGAKVRIGSAGVQRKFAISELNLWGKGEVVFSNKKSGDDDHNTSTELVEIVKHIKSVCEKLSVERLPKICMAPLANTIMLNSIPQPVLEDEGLHVVLGVYDDPDNQLQEALTMDLSSSNTYIIGSAQMGKTSLLQTMIVSMASRYSAGYVNVYVVDGSSSITKNMEKANIIGGIAYLDEEERILNLLQMIQNEIKARKVRFNGANVSSFRAYLEAGYTDLPHIVLMMDNIVAFKEYYPNLYDEYMQLTREGLSAGINVVITSAQFSAVGMRILTGFGNRLALNCNDSGEYSSLFERCRMQPADTPGRGLFMREKRILEYQTALAVEGETEKQRNERLEELLISFAPLSGNVRAKRIPVVPEKVYADEFYADYKASRRYMVPLGISYNSVKTVEMDLLETGILPIMGRGKMGKTNFLSHVLQYIQRTTLENRTEAYIIDSVEAPHEAASDNFGFIERYTIDITEVQDILSDIIDELEARQQYIIDHRKEKSESELLSQFPLILLAIENPEFCAEASRSADTMKLFSRLQKLLRFKCCVLINNVENVSAIGAAEMYKRLRDGKQAMLFDDLANNKLLDNITIKVINSYPKPLIPGDMYIYRNGSIVDKIRTVIAED
ncbi:MAG: type VII secretion protein EssC [Clostridia bacterium]|nr:type VII secretion protein EssC [Clostridia bacterium]